MFLHLEDWSPFLFRLEEKGIPHGGKIIKVYATETDPREVYAKPDLFTAYISPEPLDNEVFTYEDGLRITGTSIETQLQSYGFDDKTTQRIRALFRFGHREEFRIFQDGMSAGLAGERWLTHPIENIDGLDHALRDPVTRGPKVHLDVFLPPTLQRIKRVVDLNDPLRIIPFEEVYQNERLRIQREGIGFRGREQKY